MDKTNDVRLLGFADEEELHRLVAAAPLWEPGALERFKAWQHDDGTKEGLVDAFPDLAC